MSAEISASSSTIRIPDIRLEESIAGRRCRTAADSHRKPAHKCPRTLWKEVTSAEIEVDMGWLAFGAAYSILYAIAGAYLRQFPAVLPWFRIVALLVPPLTGVAVILRRRHAWLGCQWLFWATLALGLVMSGI